MPASPAPASTAPASTGTVSWAQEVLILAERMRPGTVLDPRCAVRLDDSAVVSSLLLLCWAGTEAALPAIATALYAVLTQPGAAERARSAPGGALDVADEALRWEAPVQVTSRRVTREVELAARALPAGAIVLAHLGSGNRDEREFADPDRFDPHRFDSGRADSGRGPARHLAFGSGPHRCLGWQLARAEVAACLTAVLTRLPGLRLAAGSPPPEGAVVRSPRRVLVQLS